jgi:hypothetical protein
LHVACCMLHVACCMLNVECCMLNVACCMLHVEFIEFIEFIEFVSNLSNLSINSTNSTNSINSINFKIQLQKPPVGQPKPNLTEGLDLQFLPPLIFGCTLPIDLFRKGVDSGFLDQNLRPNLANLDPNLPPNLQNLPNLEPNHVNF